MLRTPNRRPIALCTRPANTESDGASNSAALTYTHYAQHRFPWERPENSRRGGGDRSELMQPEYELQLQVVLVAPVEAEDVAGAVQSFEQCVDVHVQRPGGRR